MKSELIATLLELEALGHKLEHPPEMTRLALTLSLFDRVVHGSRGLYVAAYTYSMEDLKQIRDVVELDRQAIYRTALPDDFRARYWKRFPIWLLQARVLKDPVRKHSLGGVMLSKKEFYVLYETLREAIRDLRELANDPSLTNVATPTLWQKIFGIKPSLDQAQKLLQLQLQKDILILEEFYSDVEKMWGKRGIETYMIWWG